MIQLLGKLDSFNFQGEKKVIFECACFNHFVQLNGESAEQYHWVVQFGRIL